MPKERIRISVEITDDTLRILDEKKDDNGSSISFEANRLIEWAINEKNRKKKNYKVSDYTSDSRSGDAR